MYQLYGTQTQKLSIFIQERLLALKSIEEQRYIARLTVYKNRFECLFAFLLITNLE